jgi:hypothetical protein
MIQGTFHLVIQIVIYLAPAIKIYQRNIIQ